MIGSLSSAEYLNGEIVCSLTDSLYLGYPNTVYQYGMANCISFPNDNTQPILSSQNDAQVDIIGYRNNITDPNFNIYEGEFCSYSNDWYMITGNNNGNNGVMLQSKVQNIKENMMMGQSTNKVLTDIIDLLNDIAIFSINVKTAHNTHIHLVTPEFVVSPPAIQIVADLPNPNKVENDRTNIGQGSNLAGYGYNPPPSEVK